MPLHRESDRQTMKREERERGEAPRGKGADTQGRRKAKRRDNDQQEAG